MPRPVRMSMNLLRPSSYANQSFIMQPATAPQPRVIKQTPTMAIGVGMIDRLSKNVASCNACGH